MKFLVLDAGPIISLSMNGLLPVLEKLKKSFDGFFVITPDVYREVVERPMNIKKFKLEAIKVKRLIDSGVITLSKDFVDNTKLHQETVSLLKAANGVFRSKHSNEKITILHDGEASCLAFANLCKGDSLIVIDERTTRLLFESPQNLLHLMEKKIHTPLDSTFSLLKKYPSYKFVRSAELVYFAYTKNLLGYGKGKEVLDGLLYALKFHGTTISSQEIEYLKRL